jgi:hypothetical protein
MPEEVVLRSPVSAVVFVSVNHSAYTVQYRNLTTECHIDGYPIEDATEIAVETIRSLLEKPEYDNVSEEPRPLPFPQILTNVRVWFCRCKRLFSASSAQAHKRHMKRLCQSFSLPSQVLMRR